jgi:chitin disaccharide deacetylase
MSKRLTLCADDFAQSRAISSAIMQLLASGRLSATSVMSQSPLWPELAPALKALASQVDIGLHFNLSQPFDTSARPLQHWLLRSQLGLLSRATLREQWLEQIDRFTEQLGQLPDFIDGHQHVHALPLVREAMFEAIALRWPGSAKPYLRAPDRLAHNGDSGFKAVLLKGLCRGFTAQAQVQGYAVTPWFAGLYSLSPEADYADLMHSWLAACADGGLLMCHPGLPAADRDDPIAQARVAEYGYLASVQFAEDCLVAGVEIGRFQPH